MRGYDLVKEWNRVKSKSHGLGSSENPSGLCLEVDAMIEKYGEEEMIAWFRAKMNDAGETDIYRVLDNGLNFELMDFIKKFKEEKEDKAKSGDFNVLKILSGELMTLLGKELANNVEETIKQKLDAYVENKVMVKIVKIEDKIKKVDGIAHEKFETILKFVAMDEPVFLVGPAGSGKNVIVKQVADALGLDFFFSNAVTQEYKITGFVDAMGNFQKTQFFEAFTNGGLFLLDEIDASAPEVLVVMNAAIANRYFDFPGVGRIEAHKDFRVVACGNTYGTGASIEYVGRNQLDGASLNRFAIVEVHYDSHIENLVGGGSSKVVEFCQEFRKACEKNGVKHIVSYREIGRLHKMIDGAQMNIKDALKSCVIKGLENDTLRMIARSMSDTVEYKKQLNEIINN